MRRFLALIAALLAFSPVLAQQTGGGGGSGLPAGGTSSNMLIGTPAWTTVFPNGMTGTTQATGDASADVSTDSFVALAIAGVNPASAVNEATAVAVLPNTPTYNNGTAGVGATLTAGSNTALTVDSVSVALNDRVLVKDQASTFQNGVYTETQVGTGSVPWILTRATDYNTPANINYTGTVSVIAGTVNANTDWLLVSTIAAIGSPNAITYVAQTNGPNSGGGGSIKCKPPLLANAVMIGAGGANCATLASTGVSGQVLLSGGAAVPAFGNIAGVPQGRLTLTSGAPVMTSDVVNSSTIYYDNYVGPAIIYYNGIGDAAVNIAGGEISDVVPTSSTGVANASDNFDEFFDHISAKICHATNGSGGGWSSDTGGSTTARGTGYSQLHNTRGYWTNVNSITHCYNGATDEGSLSADQATYLGTFYTTGAGTTTMQFKAASASGGSNAFLALWNAYNRVLINSWNQESASGYTATSSTFSRLNASSSNRVTIVDGIGQSPVDVKAYVFTNSSAGGVQGDMGVLRDATSGTPITVGLAASTSISTIAAFDHFAPAIGLHYFQMMEADASNSGTVTFYNGGETLSLAN